MLSLRVEMKLCFGLLALTLLLLSASSEAVGDAAVGVGMEKRTCESKSHHFKGVCLSDHNCGLVCRNEGFTNGWCRGFRHRCFCTRRC